MIFNNSHNNIGGSINLRNMSRNNLITVIRTLKKMFKSYNWILRTCLEVLVREYNCLYIRDGRMVVLSTSRKMTLVLMKE